MSEKLRRIVVMVICAVVVLSVSLLGVGCASEQPATEGPPPTTGTEPPYVDEWVIPNLTVSTGPLASLQDDQKWALEQAAEDVNAAGGIRGVPIVIEHYDTALDPDKAVQMFAKAAEGRLIVTGPAFTGECIACGPIAEQIGIPFLTIGTAWKDNVEFIPWMISLAASDPDCAGAAFGEYLALYPDVKSVVAFYVPEQAPSIDEVDMSMDVARGMGVEVLPNVAVPATTVDFTPVVLKAMAEEPDAYFLGIWGDSAVQTIKELKSRGVDPARICIGYGNFGDWFFQLGGEIFDGTYIVDLYNAFAGIEEWEDLMQVYNSETDKRYPQQAAVHYYDRIWMIKDAIEEMGITGDPAKLADERVAIRDWFYTLDGWQGVTKSYTIYPKCGGCLGVGFLYIMEGATPVFVAEAIPPVPDYCK